MLILLKCGSKKNDEHEAGIREMEFMLFLDDKIFAYNNQGKIFRDFIEHFWSWVARDEGCIELGNSGKVA